MANETTVLMKVPDVIGSSTLEGFDPGPDGKHTEWVPVHSCSFSFSRDETVVDPSKEESESEAKAPPTRVDPFTVKRTSDYSTADLLQWLAEKPADPNEKKRDILVDYVMPSGRYYLRYELTGAEIVSCALSYTDPAQADETLVFRFDHVRIFQRPVDITGTVDVGAETVAEYAVEQQT
jgi:type VI protein secretion system component Hcp